LTLAYRCANCNKDSISSTHDKRSLFFACFEWRYQHVQKCM
jgi:hypothetical protein